MKKKIAIFASGNGTNLEAILEAVKSGKIKAEVPFCFSDKPDARALERARRLGFHTETFRIQMFGSKEKYEQAIVTLLEKHKIDLVVLAGYMKIVGPTLLDAYKNRIINIHPALLPAFKGATAIKDAFEAGEKETGVSVHYVTEEVDGGPIILQRKVEVKSDDTLESLEQRVHETEWVLYPEAINLVLEKS